MRFSRLRIAHYVNFLLRFVVESYRHRQVGTHRVRTGHFAALSSCLAMTLGLLTPAVQAEVVDAENHGFTVRQEVAIIAPPETVWRMLVGHVGEWWHSDHTYSGDAANLYIEARPLGCFCERLSESDAVVHLTVTVIRENSLLRLTGGLGPLGLMGVDGNMTLSLVSDTGMTRLAMQYQVGGYSPDGLEEIAPAVDAMLSEQLTRLVRFIESGSPELDDVMLEEGMPMPAEPSLEDAAEDNTTPSELTQPTEQGEAVEPTDTPVVPQDDGDSETPENSS